MRSLSLIIPAYNEEARLPATFLALEKYFSSREWGFLEILVVDDGSRDGTAEAVRKSPYKLLQNPGNRGKGYSVRHGMLEAKGEWVLFSDADLSAPIEELDKLFEAAGSAGAAVAIGSRAVDRSLVSVHQSAMREYSGRFFNLVMRVLTGLPFKDTQCGFKLFRRDAAYEVARRQKIDGFGFDVEQLYIATQLGFKIVETPVRWANVEGTKVSLLRGLDAFADIARTRWNGLAGRYK